MWQLPPGTDGHFVTERENFCYHGTVQTSEMWCAVYMCLSSGPLLSVTQKPFVSVHSPYFTYNYISSVCCNPKSLLSVRPGLTQILLSVQDLIDFVSVRKIISPASYIYGTVALRSGYQGHHGVLNNLYYLGESGVIPAGG